MIRLLLIATVIALAFAGVPTVDQSFASFNQNGGTLVVTGSGFVRDLPTQFNWVLTAGTLTFNSNPTLRGGAPPADWFGCNTRTLVVNAAGTRVTCTMEYIPDLIMDSNSPVTISLDVVNQNGALASGAVQVATVINVDERIFQSTTDVLPEVLHGITVIGVGFPAFDSLIDPLTDIDVELTTNTGMTIAQINYDQVAAGVRAAAYHAPAVTVATDPSAVSLTDFAYVPAYADVDPSRECECVYDRNRIDCYFCGSVDFSSAGTTPNHALFAQVSVVGAATSPMWNFGSNLDSIGPAQIGEIDELLPPPTLVNSAASLPWNADTLVVSGTNFATFPSIQSNIIVPLDSTDLHTVHLWRCVPFSVNAAGSQMTCLPSNLRPALTGTVDVEVFLFVGEQFAFFTSPDPLIGNTQFSLGSVDLASPAPEIDIRTAPVQQDARYLTITSGNGAFPVDARVSFPLPDPSGTPDHTSVIPENLATTLPFYTVVTLTGILPGATVECTYQKPYNDIPVWDATATPPVRGCVIDSMTSSEMRLRIPPISTQIGDAISAEIELFDVITAISNTNGAVTGTTSLFTFPATTVGLVSPGAGVGGDPHFFGFLGEKYDFAGTAGGVYNILTDEDLQLNALIGKWHWTKGSETIIKSLALKTKDHKLFIDAGGNHLGTSGFSITLDGVHLEPNATEPTYLGNDGWVRWNPIDADHEFHLPLWERHQGVAVVEIMLNDYHFQVLSIEEGKDSNGVWHKQPSRFLDFMCQMLDEDRRPHGLFGQSAHLPAGKRDVEGWSIEGEGSDYKVSDLFADDFVFNKFSA